MKTSKLFIIFFMILHSISAFSQGRNEPTRLKMKGSKELPLELNLLVESLDESLGHEKFLPEILSIDSYARSLNKEDIFLIGKIEIYKALLKTNKTFPKASIDENSNKKLREGIKKATDPFVKWFLKAILADCETLMTGPNYKDYLLQKNNARLDKLELKKIDKKVKLLYRWVSKVNPDSADFQDLIKAELVPVMLEALVNLEKSFFLMASETKVDSLPTLISSPKELKYFTLLEVKMPKQATAVEKSVEDILSPITDENGGMKPILPKPSTEDWLNEDNAPLNLKNLPKPTDDADWLQDF